jgi:hypothetical protein
VAVAVLLIRCMGVNVRDALVRVHVCVRRGICLPRFEFRMLVLVMLVVVRVPMLVLFRGMDVFVFVAFRCV